MNAIGACPVQLNQNMWEVITVRDHLNEKWKKEGKVRRITLEDVLQFYGVKNFNASGGPYFCARVTRRRFFDLNSAGQTWNDNIIWVKGNCLQRDDEKPLDLRFRTVKQSVKSKVERKESLFDEVAEEETKLKLVLEGLGLSRKKKVDSRSNKKRMLKALSASGTTGSGEVAKNKRRRVEPSGESGEKIADGRFAMVDDLKEVEERVRLAVLHGEEDTSKMVAHLVKGIWLDIEEEKNELKKANLLVETNANLDEMVEEYDRLGHYLMLKGYSEEEVDVIKTDTYVEEEDEEEAEAVGIVDGLDGVSCQTVLHNQGDDVELPEGGSEKAVREMSLRINNLESELARERKTSKAYCLRKQSCRCNDFNERVARLKAELAQAIAHAKKAEARDHSGGSETERRRAQLLDLEAMNLAESARYIKKLEENVIYHAKVDAEMTEQKNEYARLESYLEKVRARFVIMVIPDASRSDLLKALLHILSDKECICRAKIDRRNYLGVMETQLAP
ncbi:hypothetical protein GIB67_018248 [Kingdonia uniflora]|uniref:Uncharacterized protein n=1 Tax=Kingdonia uniflora TaxID=39325 RepID=A0A7J7LCV0_9MAGN|nr:hypothetical protein GIB67_018248 [Kingdonia uniflora]